MIQQEELNVDLPPPIFLLFFRIRINNQWRICFIWEEDNAIDVEIVDYH